MNKENQDQEKVCYDSDVNHDLIKEGFKYEDKSYVYSNDLNHVGVTIVASGQSVQWNLFICDHQNKKHRAYTDENKKYIPEKVMPDDFDFNYFEIKKKYPSTFLINSDSELIEFKRTIMDLIYTVIPF